jgi:ABC-type branched-subunit amino acid transport system ATPase component
MERSSDVMAKSLLEFVGLLEKANELAAELADGERGRRLEQVDTRTGNRAEVLPAPTNRPPGRTRSEKVELTELIRRVRDEMACRSC